MSKNKRYWERRAERNYETMERSLDEQYKDMVRSFDTAKQEIESQIHEFYFKYSNNNKISYEEAQKLLSFEELKGFKDDLETFRRKSIDSIGTFNLEVENLSMQARVTRLQALNTNIEAVLNQLYKSNHEKIGDAAAKEFEEQYYRQLFDIDQYYGVHFNFSALDYQTIKEAVTMPINGANYSERIWRQNQDLSYKLRTALMNTIVTGKNPAELVKGVAKDFDVKKYEAYRLLNTEASTVHSTATMNAYEADGIDQYEILATLDSKTSQICREMDGKVFDVVKRKQGENAPPFHPNCRTTTVAYFPELSEIPHERIARDETGKTYDVPGNMTYSKWKSQFVAEGDTWNVVKKTAINTLNDSRIKSVKFNKLPKEFQDSFNKQLSHSHTMVKDFITANIDKANIKFDTLGERSYYNSLLGYIKLNKNDPSTFAHEFFHYAGRKFGWLKDDTIYEKLQLDYLTLKNLADGDITKYLKTEYEYMFRGKRNFFEEYRGVSDILNGLSHGTLSYGYIHTKNYWNNKTIPDEAIAQFGRILFDNDKQVIDVLHDLFPNFVRSMEKLLTRR
ncbi:MAG: minor capsid protein [Anaerorhabdus sp.]|uniref:minor capsid protein n=1 Tax=Anaerorhabdus sp. TaxID=1872524 RepID=UPI003A871EA0